MPKRKIFDRIKIPVLILCITLLLVPLSSCSEKYERGTGPLVEITMESGDVIQVYLDSDAAPITVENFVNLVEDGFYDGLTIHYIIPGTLIQGGDPEGTGQGSSDEKIKGEFSDNGWDNPISFERGVIGMARRSSNYDAASCQFFITTGDATYFDGMYAGFGYVVKGMKAVDEIASTELGNNGKPVDPPVIETIRIKE